MCRYEALSGAKRPELEDRPTLGGLAGSFLEQWNEPLNYGIQPHLEISIAGADASTERGSG